MASKFRNMYGTCTKKSQLKPQNCLKGSESTVNFFLTTLISLLNIFKYKCIRIFVHYCLLRNYKK